MSDVRMQIAFANLLKKKAAGGLAAAPASAAGAAGAAPRASTGRGAQPESLARRLTKRKPQSGPPRVRPNSGRSL